MPLSTDVNLPKDHLARFPDKCVVCGYPAPASTVRILTGSIGWWSWLLFTFGKPFAVKAPACARCGWRLQLQRFVSLFITIALICLALWFLWPVVPAEWPRALRKWIMLGLALVCLAPQIIFEMFFPRPFDLTAHSDSVDYEFRDQDMAFEFAQLNEDAAWVRIE